MTLRLLTEHHLEFLRLKGGRTGSLESSLVKLKMPHCWKSNEITRLYTFNKTIAFHAVCVSGKYVYYTILVILTLVMLTSLEIVLFLIWWCLNVQMTLSAQSYVRTDGTLEHNYSRDKICFTLMEFYTVILRFM